MDTQEEEQILGKLETKVHEVGTEVRIRSDRSGVKILSFFTPMHDDGSGLVYFELCFAECREEGALFQIFATILPEIADALPELEKAIAAWNLTTLIGVYGVDSPHDQMYFKHRFLLGETAKASAAENLIMNSLYLCYDEINSKYDAAVSISDGNRGKEED
jgi:hypothetical protein